MGLPANAHTSGDDEQLAAEAIKQIEEALAYYPARQTDHAALFWPWGPRP